MHEVTNNWLQLGDTFYDKVELYSGVFDSVPPSATLVSGQHGGPVLVADRLQVTVFTSSGQEISQWKWNNPPQIAAGWTEEEDAVFVLEDGSVLLYSMFGQFKSVFSMGQEAKDIKIVAAKIYPSHTGTGVAVLTTTHRFYSVASVTEPRVRKLFDSGELPCAAAWAPLAYDRQAKLLVGRGAELLLLSHNDMTVLDLQPDPGSPGSQAKVVMVACSHSQTKIAAVLDSWLLWLGTLTRRIVHHQLDGQPASVTWCGEEAVYVSYPSGQAVLVHTSGQTEVLFGPSPLAVTQECDGVRVLCPGYHDLLHAVSEPVAAIYRVGSISPGSLLLLASQHFNEKSHRADEYVRMIGSNLDQAVAQCVSAAGALFQPHHQKQLMKAAQFGKNFLQGFSSEAFTNQCQTLRLLNAVRHYKVGLPLTQLQLEALSRPALIDRLILRRLFPLAIAICDYLRLPPQEGKNRVLGHWACYKVENSAQDEPETARQVSAKLGFSPDISYSEIAGKAAECGKKRLAVQLLEHEIRADRQVPLLLRLGQGAQALTKAIDSGDTDLMYTVILSLQEQHSSADFHMIIRQVPLGAALYTKYCRQYQPLGLQDWLQQEDDWNAMAGQSLVDSYNTGRIETRLASLVTASELYKKAKADFNLSAVEETHKLLKYQAGLEDKFGKTYVDKSLHETLSQLLQDGEYKLAEKLKSEFKVTDRKFLWIKVRAFGKSKQWHELNNLAKAKKSLIGFGPFIDVCLAEGEKSAAVKFLPLLPPEEKLKYLMKLQLYGEAAEVAFTLRNMEALTAIEVKCVNNFSQLEQIAGLKQKLQANK